ncbi:transferrin-binding protein-like solute binding protein [Sphingobium sp. EM0848]|uniref:transferrin-binding protein-like solute binding protein n=1 Tax=Sphingobium sp. EM0848 TaxID=2743473 RepID=UPI00159C533E
MTPPTPTLVSTMGATSPIPSPATRPGTYDTIALIEHIGDPSTIRLAEASEVRITTYQTTPSSDDVAYTIEFASTDLPGGKASLINIFQGTTAHEEYPLRFGDRATITEHYSDGSAKAAIVERTAESSDENSEAIGSANHLWHTLFYNIGLSHVSLGEWMWRTIRPDGVVTDAGQAFFVHGDRTPVAEIPLSGTATYSAASLGFSTDEANWNFPGQGAPVAIGLTADFGQRSIAAQLDREGSLIGDTVGGFVAIQSIHAQGTGQIASAGDFSIPLTGTVGDVAATGAMDGAFFGPNAEQVGGVFTLQRDSGPTRVSDAFVGTRN